MAETGTSGPLVGPVALAPNNGDEKDGDKELIPNLNFFARSKFPRSEVGMAESAAGCIRSPEAAITKPSYRPTRTAGHQLHGLRQEPW